MVTGFLLASAYSSTSQLSFWALNWPSITGECHLKEDLTDMKGIVLYVFNGTIYNII